MEGAWALAGQGLQSLSEQCLVSCDATNDGCNGGWPYNAMTYVQEQGIVAEADYAYTSGQGVQGACERSRYKNTNISVSGFARVPTDETQLMAYVANFGPISVALDAMV